MTKRYLIRRLLQVVPVTVGILIATFAVIHLAPGSPELAFADPESASPEFLASLRSKWGLDRPVTEQFLAYAGNALTGDLGESYDGRQVTQIIGERLWPTLLLTGTALVLSCVVGIGLGVMTARRPFRGFDAGVNTATLLGHTVPVFFVAHVAILLFVARWELFPLFGMEDQRVDRVGVDHVLDVAHHLMLPALVLTVSEVAVITRLTRARLMEEMAKDYVRTAAAKGVPDDRVVVRHALPNAILPVVTVIGSRIGFLLAGAAIVETIFSWPGLGSLLVESATTGNRPVLLGMVLLIAFAVLVANVVTDLVAAWIDPRVRFD